MYNLFVLEWHEVAKAFVMVGFVKVKITEKSCKHGEY